MRWKKCNHRHALSRDYDYFYQAASRSQWRWLGPSAREVVQYLRNAHGPELLETEEQDFWGYPKKKRNPTWYLDRGRNRIWIKESAMTILVLKGLAGAITA